MVVVLLRKRDGNRGNLWTGISTQATHENDLKSLWVKTHVLEQSQHLRVRRVIRNGEGQVRVAQNGSNSNQAGTATGHDAHILPGVLARLALTIMLVV